MWYCKAEDLAEWAQRAQAELDGMRGDDAFTENAIEVMRRGIGNLLGAIAARRLSQDVEPHVRGALDRAQARAREIDRDDPGAT